MARRWWWWAGPWWCRHRERWWSSCPQSWRPDTRGACGDRNRLASRSVYSGSSGHLWCPHKPDRSRLRSWIGRDGWWARLPWQRLPWWSWPCSPWRRASGRSPWRWQQNFRRWSSRSVVESRCAVARCCTRPADRWSPEWWPRWRGRVCFWSTSS